MGVLVGSRAVVGSLTCRASEGVVAWHGWQAHKPENSSGLLFLLSLVITCHKGDEDREGSKREELIVPPPRQAQLWGRLGKLVSTALR